MEDNKRYLTKKEAESLLEEYCETRDRWNAYRDKSEETDWSMAEELKAWHRYHEVYMKLMEQLTGEKCMDNHG